MTRLVARIVAAFAHRVEPCELTRPSGRHRCSPGARPVPGERHPRTHPFPLP